MTRMTRMIGRLALALLGVFVLARAAAAHEPGRYYEPEPSYSYQERGYVDDGYGYDDSYGADHGSDYGYVRGYRAEAYETGRYSVDRRGVRLYDRSGDGWEEGYGREYGDRGGRREPVRYAPQPVYEDVRLSDGFFRGGLTGGVGPGIIHYGGGGRAYVIVGANASASARSSAFAYARASSSVRVGGRGGGCGCR